VFTIPTAQELLEREGKFDAISVAAKEGVSADELVADIKPILPPTAQVRTGVEQAEDDAAEVSEFVSFIRYFLLAFGGVALFVGAFVIFNTMSITVAQRTRELATLRTIGASRKQIRRAVLLEALVIGAYVRGLSDRDIESLAREAGLASISTVLEMPNTEGGSWPPGQGNRIRSCLPPNHGMGVGWSASPAATR